MAGGPFKPDFGLSGAVPRLRVGTSTYAFLGFWFEVAYKTQKDGDPLKGIVSKEIRTNQPGPPAVNIQQLGPHPGKGPSATLANAFFGCCPSFDGDYA